MAGSILGQGYLAGFGMTIGTVFGRIAGREAEGAPLPTTVQPVLAKVAAAVAGLATLVVLVAVSVF